MHAIKILVDGDLQILIMIYGVYIPSRSFFAFLADFILLCQVGLFNLFLLFFWLILTSAVEFICLSTWLIYLVMDGAGLELGDMLLMFA
jgi:hypothetical protein